jgi:hypothetical protein
MLTENESKIESPETKDGQAEKLVSDAVETIAKKDAADSVISSGWTESVKNFWKDDQGANSREAAKTIGAASGIAAGGVLFLGWRVLKATFEFAKKAIQKKGNVGFKDGVEIGEKMLSFDEKDKK